MQEKFIESKDELKQLLKDYENTGVYAWAVKARDTFLSGWGNASGKTHYQFVICTDMQQAYNIKYSMCQDKTFKNINILAAKDLLRGSFWGESFTIRGSWGLAGVYNF